MKIVVVLISLTWRLSYAFLQQTAAFDPAMAKRSTTALSASGTAMTTSVINEGWMPLILSCIAGASTCLGAAVVFCHPRDPVTKSRAVSPGTMSFSLALAGSVMVTVSVISILPECLQDPDFDIEVYGFRMMDLASWEFIQRIVSFGLGSLLYFGLSWFAFPEPDQLLGLDRSDATSNDNRNEPKKALEDEELAVAKPATMKKSPSGSRIRNRQTSSMRIDSVDDSLSDSSAEPSLINKEKTPTAAESSAASLPSPSSWKQWSSGADLDSQDQRRAWRVALLLFVSLCVHNFPEGLAVAASALESSKLGITVTIGIMIHNIPEGIAIAVPCLAARPDYPLLAFVLASFSGLAEPLGALVAILCLRNVESSNNASSGSEAALVNMENVLAFVAGIMITVALHELFPEARRQTTKDRSSLVYGTIAGIIVMVATELYLP